nr:transketolase [candidate division Zixibacteria bacterium]
MVSRNNLDDLCVNTIRFLSADAVQKANSGHPGLPMGAAAPAYTLWNRFLKFNPADPHWPDRDRFVLSAGHGSALLYSLLHLTGYDLSLEELKNFRQWGSRTPGHPEYGLTPGVEATTGPLGQGLANAVGMAIAETMLAARFNRPEFEIVKHHTYVLAGDGDLMEGIASEAASLAGHLKLGKLVVLYDSNNITIEGTTGLTFTENVIGRFESFGWRTIKVNDGNRIDLIADAIEQARQDSARPTLIEIKTHIGYGSPHKQDTASAHGEPLGEEELRLTKEKLGWPADKMFYIPDEVRVHFRASVERGGKYQKEWQILFDKYTTQFPDLGREFKRVIDHNLTNQWDHDLSVFTAESGKIATRAASGKILNALAACLPEMVGGSADLAPSNKTLINDNSDYSPENRLGRNLRFGVREHAMGAVVNGLALHGGVIPYCGTFLIFSDYMRPAIRMAALSKLPVKYVFTHDSLGVGEDGPTHQPVEQLLSLRAIPNLLVFRPADANETSAVWKMAMTQTSRPAALALTRQKLPVLDLSLYPQLAEGVVRGGYILADSDRPGLTIAATGSEVHLALEAREKLAADDIQVRVVSLPCLELFAEQTEEYRNRIISPDLPLLVIEAGRSLGWKAYVGPKTEVIGVDTFGASAPGSEVLSRYGFNIENIYSRARKLVNDTTRAML